MVEQRLILETLDLHEFQWLLNFEDFTDGAWHSVVFQVVARAFSGVDLNLTFFYVSDVELIKLGLAINVNLDAQCDLAIVVG